MERQMKCAVSLMNSVYCENLSEIQDLLVMGADPNLILKQGISAFHLVVGLDEISDKFALDATSLMLQYGANPNIRNVDGVTPVHIAAMQGRDEVLRMLLHNGGDPQIIDKEGQDAVAMAIECCQQTAVRIIKNFLLECDLVENQCCEAETSKVSWKFNGYVSNSEYGSTCFDESGQSYQVSDYMSQDWALGCQAERLTNRTSKRHQITAKQKSLYTEKVQKLLDNIDTRCHYLDVTSPDHPQVMKRDIPDTTLAVDLSHTLNDKDATYLLVDSEVSFGQLSSKTMKQSDTGREKKLTFAGSSFNNYRTTERVQRVASPDDLKADLSRASSCLSNGSSCTFYSCETDKKQVTPAVDKQNEALDHSHCSNCSQGNSEFCLDHRGSGDATGHRVDINNKTTRIYSPNFRTSQCLNRGQNHSTHTHQTHFDRTANKQSVHDWLVSFQDLKVDDPGTALENMSLMTLDDSNFEANLPSKTDRYVTRSATVEGTLNETFTVQQDCQSGLPAPMIDQTAELTKSSASSSQTFVYNTQNNQDHSGSSEKLSVSQLNTALDSSEILPDYISDRESKRSSARVSEVSQCTIEEYIYTDDEASIKLVEWRCLPDQNNTVSSFVDQNNSQGLSNLSYVDWRSFATSDYESGEDTLTGSPPVHISLRLQQLNNSQLTQRLRELGDQPGPITQSTRQIYLTRLSRLEKDPTLKPLTVAPSTTEFLPELAAAMNGEFAKEVADMEEEMVRLFVNPDPSRKWREGTLKSSFNYLILDPRVTQNLPCRVKSIGDNEAFGIFISSIFYIGKGKRARPFSHFYEAISQIQSPKEKVSAKVKHILDIWQDGLGAISLHCFQNVIPVEAYTREACMVEAMGLSRLTNVKKGDYYGISATWTAKKRRTVGAFLLKKAFNIFLNEGEHQIKPFDLKVGQ